MREDTLFWWYKKKSRKTSDCSLLFPPCGSTTRSLELFLKKKKNVQRHNFDMRTDGHNEF